MATEWDRCIYVLEAFVDHNISVSQFMSTVFQYHEALNPRYMHIVDDVFKSADTIMALLSSHPRTRMDMCNWAHGCASQLYASEIGVLARQKWGLHFNAANAQANQVTEFKTETLIKQISSGAPYLWNLSCVLVKANEPLQNSAIDEEEIKPQHIVSSTH